MLGTPGSKTPISILNEYLVSKKLKAIYELVDVGGTGPNNPIFKFIVKVKDLQCEGQGSSKQEARQRAAEGMLKILQCDEDKTNIQTQSDWSMEEFFENDLRENYVGVLKEYCLSHLYPEPEYDLEEEAGPPHSKIFKMVCFVSNLKDCGIAKTKKLAKHHSALKMLERLKKLNISDQDSSEKNLPKTAPQKVIQSCVKPIISDEVVEIYNATKNFVSPNTNKYSVSFYKDHHKAYIGLQDTSPTLLSLMESGNSIDKSMAYSLVEKIINELRVSLCCVEIQAAKNKTPINNHIITISIVPQLAGMGESKGEAAINLLNTLITLCKM